MIDPTGNMMPLSKMGLSYPERESLLCWMSGVDVPTSPPTHSWMQPLLLLEAMAAVCVKTAHIRGFGTCCSKVPL